MADSWRAGLETLLQELRADAADDHDGKPWTSDRCPVRGFCDGQMVAQAVPSDPERIEKLKLLARHTAHVNYFHALKLCQCELCLRIEAALLQGARPLPSSTEKEPKK